ncbi:MAG: signal peptidase I [Dehalococcoidia bacterium]|nr:signal peptidase I [Dehalococcoidia bacterium]
MREVIRELVHTALVSLAVFLSIHFSIENFRVDGFSMTPTLVDGQHLIANKLVFSRLSTDALTGLVPFVPDSGDDSALFAFHPPERGDVMVFLHPRDPSRALVKRVIGLPRDVIEIDTGQVVRNGESLDEPYVVNTDTRSFDPAHVPEDSYYVLGDNRLVSSDSRHWGFVSDEYVIGRAWLSYWPSDRIEFLHAPW